MNKKNNIKVIKLMIIPLCISLIGYFCFLSISAGTDISIDLTMNEEVKISLLNLSETIKYVSSKQMQIYSLDECVYNTDRQEYWCKQND